MKVEIFCIGNHIAKCIVVGGPHIRGDVTMTECWGKEKREGLFINLLVD